MRTPLGSVDNVVRRQLGGEPELVARGSAVAWEACG
jgi:hypothetical protein